MLAFIFATFLGTLAHEWGHFLMAKYYGYSVRFNHASVSWWPAHAQQIVSPKDSFYITLGGPVQTLLTATIGLTLLFIYRKKFFSSQALNWRQWAIIIISLFWLRQTVNLFMWIAVYLIKGKYSTQGDEIKIAKYLELPDWSILTLSASIGIMIFLVIVFKFIPLKQRSTFVAAILAGGVSGYILWIELLGRFIVPE